MSAARAASVGVLLFILSGCASTPLRRGVGLYAFGAVSAATAASSAVGAGAYSATVGEGERDDGVLIGLVVSAVVFAGLSALLFEAGSRSLDEVDGVPPPPRPLGPLEDPLK